jgi:hypothetical protein
MLVEGLRQVLHLVGVEDAGERVPRQHPEPVTLLKIKQRMDEVRRASHTDLRNPIIFIFGNQAH